MQIFITILVTILVFGLLILVHESGHFLIAKACKVKVLEFSLGMGPALFKKQGKNTMYCLRVLPIGGFVQMDGEDGDGIDDNSFDKKPRWQRFFILFAGAALNILLGFIIICVINSVVNFSSDGLIRTNIIAKFDDDAVSNSCGLQQNDEIIKINDYKINNTYDYATVLGSNGVKPLTVTVIRNGKTVVVKNVRFIEAEDEKLGKYFQLDFIPYGQKLGLFGIISYSFKETVSVSKSIYSFLGSLFTGGADINQVSGPVGTSAAIGESVRYGLDSLLLMVAIISVNLGIVNLLPFPALDGGRILLLLVESIRRKPLNPKIETAINAAGLIFLLALMAVISLKDVINLF